MFIYFAIIDGSELILNTVFIFFSISYYLISGLRRLIQFNIDANAGELTKYFIGVPTPLGAILLWIVYLLWNFGFIPSLFSIPNQYFVLISMIIIGYLLNSKIKIPHP
jgi:CDP-diacylglycerol--serine O-phosphatidyltransferase